jgi:hypothetical protein
MEKPVIHLNGTSVSALEESLANAGRAVREAIGALYEASPNARDYYPNGPAAYDRASKEHAARIAALRTVLDELTELYESLP